jgi:hypothetical protein
MHGSPPRPVSRPPLAPNLNVKRRRFLQTSTALIALPLLESPGFRRFASAAPLKEALGAQPKRLLFIGFGWGVTEKSWYPKQDERGADYTLPGGLAPLERHKSDFSICQGLANRDTANGHYGSTCGLTGANEFGEPGQSFHNGVPASTP